MQKQTPRRTTTHPNSHDEDGDGEGGKSGHPFDLQTTLDKLHVGSSEDRDQAEQLSDSEASSSMEDLTARRRTAMQEREASRDGGNRTHRRRDGNTTTISRDNVCEHV